MKVKDGDHAGRAGHVTNGDADDAIEVLLDATADQAAEAVTLPASSLEVL